MCFRKKFRKEESAILFKDNPKVAKKDIVVYKALKKISDTIYRAPYFKKRTYYRGFHYYQTGEKFGINIRTGCGYTEVQISVGLHSNIGLSEAKKHIRQGKSNIIVEMIIPKGAEYYKNKKDYVSDQLIFPLKRMK